MDILSGQEEIYDNALMGILQSCGKLQPFLDAVFSFLARRTDFYIIMQHPKAKMGFPPGVAEAMVQQAFKRYEILTRKREAEIMREEETRRLEKMPQKKKGKKGKVTAIPSTSPHIADELPISVPDREEPPSSTGGENTDEKTAEKTEEEFEEGEGEASGGASKEEHGGRGEEELEKGGDKAEEPPKEAIEKRAAFNLSSDTYNGADMDDYKWSQTMTDLEIRVPVTANTTAKQVVVEIRSDRLKVVLLRPEEKVVIDGPLLHRIKVQDSMWNIDKDNWNLYINLEKTKEIMWKSVLEGEKGIDLGKVDTTRNICEFDEEAQAAIERATYDNRMKMLGKPTSNEKKAHDILRKAWNAEGSPFKGTPFDPSRVHISGQW